jgi:hypothetical protein
VTSHERVSRVNWKTVQREHVLKACSLASTGKLDRTLRGRALFLLFNGQRLPAKDIARVAYLLAVGRRPDAYLDFSSGQSTLDMFKKLGFEVVRTSGPSLGQGREG